MTGTSRFDFGTLFATAAEGAAQAGPAPCIVGIAWNDEGIGIVALTLDAAMSTSTKAYINLALGPLDDDWPRLAQLIKHIPLIFAGHLPLVFLCDGSKHAGQKYPIAADFQRAFGPRTQILQHEDVELWASTVMPSIAAPQIPPCDSWTIKPIRAAAETTLYAGNQIALSFPGLAQADGEG